MRDIDIAKEILSKESLTIVLVKNGKVIYKSKARGIKPLYIVFTTMKSEMKNCSAADKVVGKSAAWLYASADIKELYCNVIAKKGVDILNEKCISYRSSTIVDYIKNRQKDDMCPVEKLAKEEVEFDKLLFNINKFLKENNLI